MFTQVISRFVFNQSITPHISTYLHSHFQVEITTASPVCIETYAESKELGRFMLRAGGITIAAGMVTDIH